MFQKSQVVLADERFLFEDQQVELLPAPTTMTLAGSPGGGRKKNDDKAVAVATVVQIAVVEGDNNTVTQNGTAVAVAKAG